MKVIPTKLEGVLMLEPKAYGDQRGYFLESYQQARYETAGVKAKFVQDNISQSVKHTLRGLHFQHPRGQAKLVQVLKGEIFDVAVDIRYGSPTFGQWVGATLSEDNHRQLYIPAGFAHGFCVLSESSLFMYKCDAYYAPEEEGGICWNDPDLAIQWPIQEPILSNRDSGLPHLNTLTAQDLSEY